MTSMRVHVFFYSLGHTPQMAAGVHFAFNCY